MNAQLTPLAALTVLSCSGGGTVTERVSAEERGQEAFADGSASLVGTACASCHPGADGAPPDRIFPGADLHGATQRTSYWGGQENNLLEAVNACRTLFQGLPELAASSPAAADLFAFLETLEGPSDPVPFTVVQDVRDLEPGDAELGLSVYENACRPCHGVLRDGAGRLNGAIPVLPGDPLAQHAAYTSEEQRLVFVEKVRHGRFFGYGGAMPPFALEPLPDENLAALLSALELYPP